MEELQHVFHLSIKLQAAVRETALHRDATDLVQVGVLLRRLQLELVLQHVVGLDPADWNLRHSPLATLGHRSLAAQLNEMQVVQKSLHKHKTYQVE